MTTMTTTSVHLRSHSHNPDLELSSIVPSPTDPYALQAHLIPKSELSNLRQRGLRRKVRKFYEDQNANIERMLKSVDEHRLAADIEQEENSLKDGSILWGLLSPHSSASVYGATLPIVPPRSPLL
jgi:hypothetical protein